MKTPEWIEQSSERRSLTYAAMLDGAKQKISRQNVTKQNRAGGRMTATTDAAKKNANLPLEVAKK
jgi:hypothetical protein